MTMVATQNNHQPVDAEVEPTPVQTRAMTTTGNAALDVSDASADGVKLLLERVENQRKMLAIAISLTSPSQWTVFAGKSGETIYPTGGASDTILRRAFGLTWGPKTVEVTRDESGDLVAVCRAWLQQGDRQVEEFEGRRKMGGFVQDEASMRKGAVENMKSVAVRDLLGLRFRTPAELREMGLDVGKLERRAEFQHHGDDPGSVAVVNFGKNKGTPISELNDKQLEWYIGAAEQNIADPEKAKWRAREEKWLAQLKAEQAGRAGFAGADGDPREPGEDH